MGLAQGVARRIAGTLGDVGKGRLRLFLLTEGLASDPLTRSHWSVDGKQ